MARVHLFTSSTQPYNYKRNVQSPDITVEEPSLLSEEDIIDNTTISEQQQQKSLDIDTATASPLTSTNFVTAPSSPEQQQQQQQDSLTNQLTSSSSALTAALLQNAHGNNDVMGAVAAALSVKPDSFYINQQQQQQQQPQPLDQSSSSLETSQDNNAKGCEDVMDQAAAVTALQLLGLSSQAEESKVKVENQPTTTTSQQQQQQPDTTNNTQQTMDANNVMLIANYPGLSSNLEDIDLNSEDMMQDYKRGTWTREEDELLLSGIKRYGYGRWKEIASSIPGRKGKQLKQRWDNTLASKYVDQEWLRNKIRNEEQLQQQQQRASSSTSSLDVNKDDKGAKFLETMDWNDIALKITEKAREGDQHGIEALLSQALLGTVAVAAAHTTPPATTTTTSSSTNTSPHQSHETVVIHPHHDSSPNTPNTTTTTTTTNDNDALGLNFTRSPIDPNNPPSMNFADAAALALYASHMQHSNNASNSSTTNQQSNLTTLANHPYFLSNPFAASSSTTDSNNNNNNNNNISAAAAAAAAAVAAVAQQAQNDSQQQNYSVVSSPSSSTPIVGPKRRRSDPALADTQSAAMTIYASATPITTTINNQTQTVYPCLFPNCGKTFARLYNLKSHSRTHTDDRPFVCHACTAAFSRNHDLKRHSKIHGGDKPYRCEGCKKSFSRLDALKRHKSNLRNKQGCTEN